MGHRPFTKRSNRARTVEITAMTVASRAGSGLRGTKTSSVILLGVGVAVVVLIGHPHW
ncbi:hypothetical protein STTU_p0125 (plasmid) [Streptomyces sp. Tu6071]|nr:hypothetical protein STTU_p0125 [Streptomyces sp. Tu6071]